MAMRLPKNRSPITKIGKSFLFLVGIPPDGRDIAGSLPENSSLLFGKCLVKGHLS